jgi:DNA-binding NarL/FixJ family response regulator
VASIRIAIFDWERTFAEALAARLTVEPDFEAVRVIQSVQSAIGVAVTEHVNILLLDGDLPGNAALSLCADISGRSDTPRVVILSDSSAAERIVRAVRAGAAAWVNKGASVEELVRAIHGVQRGESYLPSDTIGPVLRLLIERDDDRHCNDPVLAALTPREREVLFHLASGRCRRDVAERMQVSSNTVRTHLQNLMAKLGVHSSLEAMAWARSRMDRLSPERDDGDAT